MRMRKGGSILNMDTRTLQAAQDLGTDPIDAPYIDVNFGFPGDLSKVPNNREDTQGNGTAKGAVAVDNSFNQKMDASIKKGAAEPGGGW